MRFSFVRGLVHSTEPSRIRIAASSKRTSSCSSVVSEDPGSPLPTTGSVERWVAPTPRLTTSLARRPAVMKRAKCQRVGPEHHPPSHHRRYASLGLLDPRSGLANADHSIRATHPTAPSVPHPALPYRYLDAHVPRSRNRVTGDDVLGDSLMTLRPDPDTSMRSNCSNCSGARCRRCAHSRAA